MTILSSGRRVKKAHLQTPDFTVFFGKGFEFMALGTHQDKLAIRKSVASSLIFDAEGTTLIGRYKDELAAYRARKKWAEILSSYFLLESERDYEFAVVPTSGNNSYVLNCFFTSACGRYAFWRLINDQAPEAEIKLGEINKSAEKMRKSQRKLSSKGLFGKPQAAAEPFVLAGLDNFTPRNQPSLTSRVSAFFCSIFRI